MTMMGDALPSVAGRVPRGTAHGGQDIRRRPAKPHLQHQRRVRMNKAWQ